MPKTVVCDSSSLIALSECCLLSAFGFLNEQFGARFEIPRGVFDESVGRPSGIGKHAASAMRIKRAFLAGKLGVAEERVEPEAKTIMETANHLFFVGKTPLTLLQQGESECLALARKTNAAGILVDEKTLRMLVEDPQKMRQVLQNEYEGRIKTEETALGKWRKLAGETKIIRSTELLAIAEQNGFFEEYGEDAKTAFHGNIEALKLAGCSITPKEVAEYRKK